MNTSTIRPCRERNPWRHTRTQSGFASRVASLVAIHGPWLVIVTVTAAVCAWFLGHTARMRQREQRVFRYAEAQIAEVSSKFDKEYQDITNAIVRLERELLDTRFATVSGEIASGQLVCEYRELERRLNRLNKIHDQLTAIHSKINGLFGSKYELSKADMLTLLDNARSKLTEVTSNFADISQELDNALELRKQLASMEKNQAGRPDHPQASQVREADLQPAIRVASMHYEPVIPAFEIAESVERSWTECLHGASAERLHQPSPQTCVQPRPEQRTSELETYRRVQPSVLVLAPVVPNLNLIGATMNFYRFTRPAAVQRLQYLRQPRIRAGAERQFRFIAVPALVYQGSMMMPLPGVYIFTPEPCQLNPQGAVHHRLNLRTLHEATPVTQAPL